MPFYYGFLYDPMYVLVLLAILFSLFTSMRVNSTFKKYSQIQNMRGMTGAQAAHRVLLANGVTGVRIERISGDLTDHYDPKTNVIRLSDSVYDAATPAAVGVAAHEAGHAVQYATDYAPIKLRASIVNVTNIGSKLAMPMILIGILLMGVQSLSQYSEVFYYISLAGVFCYGLCVFFQLVTLPVEFNASRRALQTIDQTDLLAGEERTGAKKVLTAAAMTYVAVLAVSLMQFLRLLMMVSRRRD